MASSPRLPPDRHGPLVDRLGTRVIPESNEYGRVRIQAFRYGRCARREMRLTYRKRSLEEDLRGRMVSRFAIYGTQHQQARAHGGIIWLKEPFSGLERLPQI